MPNLCAQPLHCIRPQIWQSEKVTIVKQKLAKYVRIWLSTFEVLFYVNKKIMSAHIFNK